jgi:putative acetyltransferase
VIIRRERPGTADVDAIRAVHAAAFARPDDAGGVPVEAPLVDSLRADAGWLPHLSLVAEVDGDVVGHVVCTRGWVASSGHGGDVPVLGLGPLGVLPEHQGRGVGTALMHAVLGAAEGRDEPLVALLGEPRYYGRFGFTAAADHGIEAPDPAWGPYFQVRILASGDGTLAGPFRYAAPFAEL